MTPIFSRQKFHFSRCPGRGGSGLAFHKVTITPAADIAEIEQIYRMDAGDIFAVALSGSRCIGHGRSELVADFLERVREIRDNGGEVLVGLYSSEDVASADSFGKPIIPENLGGFRLPVEEMTDDLLEELNRLVNDEADDIPLTLALSDRQALPLVH